ncbi:hypothetical protein ACFQS1_02295 [Paractinoplanes rhizophilus]|jgi:hypothetical protein|uniref:PRC-barrel domain protein n=1 Tax=Paractinoplanes rhizophilus TaxID=1416877 RepID=A0ABW2HHV6_9ACTN|nr:hypothetical protein [Actinoplanes sp.]
MSDGSAETRGRAGDLLGRRIGAGRIADLITDDDGRVVAAIVVKGRWGRLLGYERAETTGPWLLEQFARRVWRRNAVEVAWADLDLRV